MRSSRPWNDMTQYTIYTFFEIWDVKAAQLPLLIWLSGKRLFLKFRMIRTAYCRVWLDKETCREWRDFLGAGVVGLEGGGVGEVTFSDWFSLSWLDVIFLLNVACCICLVLKKTYAECFMFFKWNLHFFLLWLDIISVLPFHFIIFVWRHHQGGRINILVGWVAWLS